LEGEELTSGGKLGTFTLAAVNVTHDLVELQQQG
jgi:cell division protein ZapA (FtsZ GTPase activity inhibitor)